MKIRIAILGVALTAIVVVSLRLGSRIQSRGESAQEPGELVVGLVEEQEEARVRVAFRYGENGWESLQTLLPVTPDSPASVSVEGVEWQVWSRPRRTVTTVGFLESGSYADRGLAVVADPATVVWSGESDPAFSGWRYVPVHPPLPAVAGIRTRPTSEIVERRASVSVLDLFPRFHERAGRVTNCNPGEELAPFEWEYGPEAVRVRGAARLSDGRELVGLRLDFEQSHCDGIPERGWSTFWFVVDQNGQITAVEPLLKTYQGPYSMHLLDVADLDGNGDPEAVFFWSGYNEDGYLLLHDRFREQEAFSWQYH